jgi:acyl carrier protein
MGLDGVELVMAIEETYGIEITDEEAGKVVTVGNLCGLVLAKLRGESTDRCLTSAAFYRIRRGLMDGLGVSRQRISPGTLLDTIFPREGRRQKWLRVQSATCVEMPDLERPAWVLVSLATFGVLMLATLLPIIYIFSRRFGPDNVLILLPFGILIVVFVLSVKLSRPLAIAFPHRAVTVGDLAKDILARNHAQLAASVGGWNKKEVWDALCRVIVNQTGVDREKVKPQARIVKDLGVD